MAARRVVLACLAVIAVTAAPATPAATPHTLGQGGDSSVAISPGGTAHVVWTAGDPGRYVYCRVPAGATACDITREWTKPSSSNFTSGPAGVFALSDTRIVITQYWCCFNEAWVVESNDGGGSFTAPALLAGSDGSPGAESASSAWGEAVYDPAGAILTIESNLGPFAQRSALGALTTRRAGPLSSGEGSIFESTLGLIGTTAIIAWVEGDGVGLQYRVASTGSDLNDEASWGPQTPLDPAADLESVDIASGLSGLWLQSLDIDAGTAPVVRKWNGTGFAPPQTLSKRGFFSELVEDPAGGLHSVYREDGSMWYRRSLDGGATWEPPVQVVAQEHVRAQPAVNASGSGVVVYQPRASNEVRIASLEPQPEAGKSVNVRPVTGKVTVKCKGDDKYEELEGLDRIPVGCLLDTRKGTVNVTAATGEGSATESSWFWQGIFKVTQKKGTNQPAVMQLAGPLENCPKTTKGSLRPAARRGRRLWGKGKGRFTTRGRRGSATVRGTEWLVADGCDDTTTVTVKDGSVNFRDFFRNKTVVVKQGKKYTARRR